MYKCDFCEKEFVTEWLLKIHTLRCHIDHKLECEFCKKYFINKKVLNKHISSVHPYGKKIKCNPCKKYFLREFALRSHEKSEIHLKVIREQETN